MGTCFQKCSTSDKVCTMKVLTVAFLVSFFILRGRAEEVCEAGAVDVVFVLDESGSIKRENYKVALEAAVEFTKALVVGSENNKSRVGLVSFNEGARVVFRLDKFSTNADVEKAILNDETSYRGGGTNISCGMNTALTQEFLAVKRREVPRLMILMTDGQDDSNVGAVQTQAAANGIVVYAIGIGAGVNSKELTSAAGDASRVFAVSDFSALKKIIQQVCHEIASVAPPVAEHAPASCGCEDDKLADGVNYWLDVIFIVDSTSVVVDEDFTGVKSFIESFGNIQIGPTAKNPKQYTRVAIINAAEQAEVLANLTTFRSGADLQATVAQKLKKKGGNVFNVQAGLQTARDMLMAESEALRRLNVPKVVVLFSTVPINCGRSKNADIANKDTNVLCSVATYLREETNLITVGLKMAGSTEFPSIDIADPCNTLDNTLDMMLNVLRAFCRANCFCLKPYTQFTVKNQCESYGECVFVHQLSLSYKSAVQTCADDGTYLANSLSAEKEQFLRGLHVDAGFYPYWVGMVRKNNAYTWNDGKPLSRGDYTNWCATKNQPNPSAGDCVYEYQCSGFSTAWFNTKCGAMLPTYYFSCQKNACSVENYCD